MSESVFLNEVKYVLAGKVNRTTIAGYAPAITDTGQQRRNSRTGASSYAFDFSRGFGVDKIDLSNPDHVGKFYDSECETRFAGQVTPPLLVNTATQEEVTQTGVATNFSLEKMENFKSKLYGVARSFLTSVTNDYNIRGLTWDPDHASTQWDDTANNPILGSEADFVIGDLKVHSGSIFVHASVSGTSYYLYSASNGTTYGDAGFTGAPACAASDEAGPILSFGTTLIVTFWDNSAGSILVYKSTDNGANVSSVCSIPSAGPALGLASWINQDGDDVPWIRTRESVGWIDLVNSAYVPMSPGLSDTADMKSLLVKGQYLLVPNGIGLRAFWYSGTTLNIKDCAIDITNVLVTEKQGRITAMCNSSSKWIFVAYGGLASGKKACIFAVDTTSSNPTDFTWHFMAKHGTANLKIIDIITSSTDDGVDRLHYQVATDSNNTTAYYLDYILDNPKQNSSMKFETDKTIVTPQFGGDEPELNGAALRLDMDADSLTAANETIGVEYGVNGAAYTTSLGTFTSADYDLDFASSVGVAMKRIQLEFTLNRAAGTNTNKPIMYKPVINYRKKAARRYGIEFVIDIEETIAKGSQEVQRSPEAIILELETLADVATLVIFKETDMLSIEARYVDVVSVGFVTSAEWSSNEVYLMERTGFIGVRLEEPL